MQFLNVQKSELQKVNQSPMFCQNAPLFFKSVQASWLFLTGARELEFVSLCLGSTEQRHFAVQLLLRAQFRFS
jgi:hypothetical protein